jgi:hypothetical protein
MSKLVPFRSVLVLGALGLFWVLPQPAMGCEICEYKFFVGFKCRPVAQNEVGSTNCQLSYSPFGGTTCEESGTYCSSIIVGGGGGTGGSGGGDGGSCQTSGFCPAACFSCSGSGGRPAV